MTTMSAAPPAASNARRGSRPNYRKIHARPLPLDTFPLPPLIPHNPFSILQIAYTYISYLLSPPKSHTPNHVSGYFSPDTNSVHVTDPISTRLLWERGFFGKGTLSRSEPTWLDREKKRLGLLANDTSEEYTQQRREERRKMKMERARKEREAIEGTLMQEKLASPREDSTTTISQNPISSEKSTESMKTPLLDPENTPASADTVKNLNAPLALADPPSIDTQGSAGSGKLGVKPAYQAWGNDQREVTHVQDEEHLQLTCEEAFFLTYGLGILQVHSMTSKACFTTSDLLILFRAHSHYPPLSASSLSPHDPFLLSYAAYHHFRSLGWVVRPGIKFAVDWLLYLRGPAFSHAEFAVVVLPAYRHPYWKDTQGRRKEVARKERRDWWWLHCLQRVQAQVRKGLVICWVEVPPPGASTISTLSTGEYEAANNKGFDIEDGALDIGELLKQYKVRDMVIKRWIPNRSRD